MAKSTKEQSNETVDQETSSVAAADIPPTADLMSVVSYVELKSPPQHITDILKGLFRRELKSEAEWNAIVQRESTRRMA
jgi:hypothetical protein